RLDLDHVGAVVGDDLGRERPHHHGGHVDDAHARERTHARGLSVGGLLHKKLPAVVKRSGLAASDLASFPGGRDISGPPALWLTDRCPSAYGDRRWPLRPSACK